MRFGLFHDRTGKPARGRWFFLLAVSALLHWTILESLSGSLWPVVMHAEPEEPIVASLHRLPSEIQRAAEPASVAKPRPRPRPRRPPPVATAEASAPAASTPEPIASDVEPQQAASETPAPDAATAESPLRASPPPSARLEYAVIGQSKGLPPYYGTGIIDWQTQGDHYTITGKASALFFTLLEFKSEGLIEETGIAPVLYEEKSRNRSQTSTHFHRERGTISFSASTASYARAGGEQDRASVIWQLAAIGRASGERFKPDAEIPLFVAGTRNAEIWYIRILGEEEIELKNEPTKTWHLRWSPRKGSYEKTIDVWLAPQLQWYPVKLRQTETSGDYFELSLSNLEPAE